MKYLVTVIIFLGTLNVFSQNKGQSIYVKNINCKYDTSFQFYEEVSLRIENDSIKNFAISSNGENQILNIKIQSKECECSDCSESFEFAILMDSISLNETINLNSKNFTWLYKNSWIQPQFITSYLGNLTMTDQNSYTMHLSELVGNTVIRKIFIKIHKP